MKTINEELILQIYSNLINCEKSIELFSKKPYSFKLGWFFTVDLERSREAVGRRLAA